MRREIQVRTCDRPGCNNEFSTEMNRDVVPADMTLPRPVSAHGWAMVTLTMEMGEFFIHRVQQGGGWCGADICPECALELIAWWDKGQAIASKDPMYDALKALHDSVSSVAIVIESGRLVTPPMWMPVAKAMMDAKELIAMVGDIDKRQESATTMEHAGGPLVVEELEGSGGPKVGANRGKAGA